MVQRSTSSRTNGQHNYSKRQLTLFQCGKTRTNKRAKITEPELNETPSPSDGDESDSNEFDGLRETGTRTNSSQQTNNIQIDKPVGATTIIINAASADSEKTLKSRSATNSQAPQSGQPCDLASLGAPPSRPVVDFPPTVFSGKKRSFNLKWYEEFEWLEYSISRDAAFCYPCRVFTTRSGKAEGTFTVTGFRDWKHASGNSGVLLFIRMLSLLGDSTGMVWPMVSRLLISFIPVEHYKSKISSLSQGSG